MRRRPTFTRPLGRISGELSRLVVVLEQAAQRAEDMKARASVIEGLVSLAMVGRPGLPAGIQAPAPRVNRDAGEDIDLRLAALRSQVRLSQLRCGVGERKVARRQLLSAGACTASASGVASAVSLEGKTALRMWMMSLAATMVVICWQS